MQVISELFIHPSALHVRLAGGSTPRSTLLRINYCCSLLGLLIKKKMGFIQIYAVVTEYEKLSIKIIYIKF